MPFDDTFFFSNAAEQLYPLPIGSPMRAKAAGDPAKGALSAHLFGKWGTALAAAYNKMREQSTPAGTVVPLFLQPGLYVFFSPPGRGKTIILEDIERAVKSPLIPFGEEVYTRTKASRRIITLKQLAAVVARRVDTVKAVGAPTIFDNSVRADKAYYMPVPSGHIAERVIMLDGLTPMLTQLVTKTGAATAGLQRELRDEFVNLSQILRDFGLFMFAGFNPVFDDRNIIKATGSMIEGSVSTIELYDIEENQASFSGTASPEPDVAIASFLTGGAAAPAPQPAQNTLGISLNVRNNIRPAFRRARAISCTLEL